MVATCSLVELQFGAPKLVPLLVAQNVICPYLIARRNV
jgi:hypothetical protein